MKICHVIINMHSGGAQTFLGSLIKEQIKHGDVVQVVLIDKPLSTNFENTLINELSLLGVSVISLDRIPGKNFSILKSFRLYHKFLKKYKPDVVNSHLSFSHTFLGFYRFFFRKMFPIKYVISIHVAPENWYFHTRLLNLKIPTIFCSHSAEELTQKRNCKSITIQNGISRPEIDNSAIAFLEKNHIPATAKLVLCVGRIAKQKNYRVVVEIAKKYKEKNVAFLICGAPDDDYNEIGSLLEEKPLYYLGVCTPNVIFSLMNKSSCFLNTSIFEGLPITVLEAFFVGVPCVLSPILPHKEIGADMEGCFLPDDFNVEDFYLKVEQALLMPLSKNEIVQKRQNQLSKFKIENTAIEYKKFYTSLS